MKAVSLFAVFVVAKVAVLLGHHVIWSAWTPVVYLWQDAFVALLFGVVEWITPRGRWHWVLYSAAVLYVALNVPLIRTLSTPMTWTMLAAAGSALNDSIRHHLTWPNVLAFAVVACAGAGFPMLFHCIRRRTVAATAAMALLLAAAGLFAAPSIDAAGLERNAFFAFVSSTLPRIRAQSLQEADWRQSPFGGNATEPLTALRGTASGRNVIVIVLESTGASHLQLYGASRDPMPNLTRLAEEAIVFEHAYAVYPESVKALIPVLCSRYPAFDAGAETHAALRTPSVAQLLRENGYRTALFHSGRFIYLGMQSIVENRGFDITEDAGDIGGNVNSSFGVDEPATISRMMQWIDRRKPNERFFIVYLPIAGHHPYETPDPRPFPESNDIDRYRNALFFADSAMGNFIDELKRRSLFEKTLFIIFGDHGEAFGEHDGNYGHTMFLYEENVHVPYLILLPGLVSGQNRVRRVSSVIDTAPTILDLLGLQVPGQYQGRSLLDDRQRMALFFTDYSLSFFGLRDGDWKFIDQPGSNSPKLFRLDRDPHEYGNVAPDFRERIDAYRHILTRWSSAQKELVLHGK